MTHKRDSITAFSLAARSGRDSPNLQSNTANREEPKIRTQKNAALPEAKIDLR